MAGSTLQTERRRQFRFNRQVVIVLAATMIALALPLGGVIFTLKSILGRRAQDPVSQTSSEGLQAMLEAISAQKLAPQQLSSNEIRIAVEELGPQKERIEGLLKAVGGTAIPTSESDSEIRLLIRVPEEHLHEFLAAVRSKEAGQTPHSSGLLEVVLTKAALE